MAHKFAREFECAQCHGKFESADDQTPESIEREFVHFFPEFAKTEERESVCEDCFKLLMNKMGFRWPR